MADNKPNISDKDKETPKPAPSYTNQEIHNADLSDIAAEWEEEANKPQEAVTPEQKPVVEEQPKEEKKEEVQVSTPPQTPAPPPTIDSQKLTDDVVKGLVDKLAPETATKEEKKDLRTKITELQKAKADKGEELSWIDAAEFLHNETTASVKEEVKAELKEELKKEIHEDLDKEVKEEETKEQQAKQVLEDQTQKLNQEWDRQFAALEERSDFPKVQNPNDANDLGAREQLALLTQMSEYNKANPQTPIMNLVEFYHTKYKSPFEKPEGANAPVYGSRRSIAPSNTTTYSNAEVHNKSIEDILAGN